MIRRAAVPRMIAFLACAWLLALLSGVPAAGTADGAFAFTSVPDTVKPYAPGTLTLSLPEAGELRVYALIGQERIPLYPPRRADQGELTLPFEGLSAAGEPLPRGSALIQAELKGSRQMHQAEQTVRVLKPAAAIQFAILSRESLPVRGGEDLYADYQLTSAQRMHVAISSADSPGSPLRSWSLDAKDDLPHRFHWDKTLAGAPAAPGSYQISFSLANSPQPAIIHDFILNDEPFHVPALSPTKTGEFLPAAMDDASVWAAVTAPIAVLNIGDMQHQQVYAEPSEKSASLGMVHGQTAGLEILETGITGFAKVRTARHGDGDIITGYVPEKKLMVIQPDTRYGLLIDKASQTLRVYEGGKFLGALSVSTGVYVPPGKDSFETISGAFLTQDRIAAFRQEGFQYDHAVRIDGGNLLHQLGYRTRNGRDFSEHQAALGVKASHGCVRIDNRINEQMISAWWLYANLPRNTKVLVVEDAAKLGLVPDPLPTPVPGAGLNPDEETRTSALPSPSPSALPAGPAPAEQADSLQAPPHDLSVVLSFAGDCVLGSEENSRSKPDSFDSLIAEKGFSWPFSGFTSFFAQDDLTLVNLENVLMDSAQDRNQKRLHNFRGPTAFARILKEGSVELVNIANNHYPDYGSAGKRSTKGALSAAGLPYAGYNSLYVYEKQGIRIGFGGIRETIYHQDKSRIRREIEQLKADGCHYIVYTVHAGVEYASRHNALQIEMAHAAIDAGANLVIGHHPHVPQGLEAYGDGLIFYSLGNFVFGGNLHLSTFDALAAQVTLYYRQGTLAASQVRLIPVITSGIIPANDFRPVPAAGADKARILSTVNADSDFVYPEVFLLPGS